MCNWCRQANKGCEHANIFGYCEMTGCTEIDLESQDKQDKQDKFALICGYSIDKVVEIVDDYKQGNLLSTKGTVKLRKGDYVLYKHSWLKEHLDMEYKVLGGKAIPIEWLEKWIKTIDNDDRVSDEEYAYWCACYLRLKWDWYKENE